MGRKKKKNSRLWFPTWKSYEEIWLTRQAKNYQELRALRETCQVAWDDEHGWQLTLPLASICFDWMVEQRKSGGMDPRTGGTGPSFWFILYILRHYALLLHKSQHYGQSGHFISVRRSNIWRLLRMHVSHAFPPATSIDLVNESNILEISWMKPAKI